MGLGPIIEKVALLDVGESLIIREYVNGIWFVFALELLALVLWRALHEWRRTGGPTWRHIRDWHANPVTAAALVVATYLAAEALMRGWVWILLKRQNDGLTVTGLWPVPLLAAAMAIAASLCAFRVFVPPPYKNKTMWLATMLAVAVMTTSELLF